MRKQVKAQSVAFFGKKTPQDDYEWLRGRSQLPPEILALCEPLTERASAARSAAAMVAPIRGEIYLLRAFRGSTDSANRPAYCLDVARLDDPDQLTPMDLLVLSHSGLATQLLDQLGMATASQELGIGTASEKQQELPPESWERVLSGLPLAVDGRAAIPIWRRFHDRFRGVAFAAETEPRFAWFPQLRGFMAIFFADPPLDDVEQEVLGAIRRRPPSLAELTKLEKSLDPDQVRAALLWAASGPGQNEEEPTIANDEWFAVFLRENYHQGRRLALLRRILGAALELTLLREALPELSEEALLCLADSEHRPTVAVLEELIRGRFFEEDEPIELRRWFEHIGVSAEALRTASQILERSGAPAGAVRLLLGEDLSAGQGPALGDVKAAAKIVLSHELPQPVESFLRLFEQSPADGLISAENFGDVAGGAVQALARLFKGQELPPPDLIEPRTLVKVLALAGSSARRLEAIALELVAAGRTNDLAELAATFAEPQRQPQLCRLTVKLIRGKLECAPVDLELSLSTPEDHASLEAWIDAGLLEPDEVIPPIARDRFAQIASLWPEKTEWLADFVRGGQLLPKRYPPLWRDRLRRLLPRPRIESWLHGLAPCFLSQAVGWWAQTFDLPEWLVELASGTPDFIPTDLDVDPQDLALIVGLAKDFAELLARLARLAETGIYRTDAVRANRMVESLMPRIRKAGAQGADALTDLLVHLLSEEGPFPPVGAIQPSWLLPLIPIASPISWVDALFLAKGQWPEVVVNAIAERVAATAGRPSKGYTPRQIQAQPLLAIRLGQLPDWERVLPDRESRAKVMERLTRVMGLTETDPPAEAGSSSHE